MANKGRVLDVTLGDTTVIYYLTDFYGLDLRKIKRGKWLLAGEWFGKSYQDYVAESLEKEE